MNEWVTEWWNAILAPLLDAFLTLDTQKIIAALYNFPHAYLVYIVTTFRRSPEHVIIETFLIGFIIYIMFFKKVSDPTKRDEELTEEEIDKLCEDWIPEPLVPRQEHQTNKESIPNEPFGILECTPSTTIKIQGINKPVVNFAMFDFLGLSIHPNLKQRAKEALLKYGCGSCGPRGFYGTIDVHENLEKKLAEFMKVPDAALYSDPEAATTSVISAFAKRGDLIIVDNGCRNSILVGVNLARSAVLYYKHNDLQDLERLLVQVREKDKLMKRNSDCQRRYVVTEAVFQNFGDILNLPAILELCEKYYFRLILDESNSFLVLGSTGRGITEYYGIDVSRVEVISASLGCAAASVGGFSIGSQEVVDYQRINSAGYVFSAAAPPFCSATCMEVLDIVQSTPTLIHKLSDNAKYLHNKVLSISKVNVLSSAPSPIVHLCLNDKKFEDVVLARNIYHEIMQKCLTEKNIAITACNPHPIRNCLYKPTIRITVTASHTHEQIDELVNKLTSVINSIA